jgi:hypothetical protein
MKHADAFLLMSAELDGQLSGTPDEPFGLSPEDWVWAYSGHRTYEGAKLEAEDFARNLFDATQRGDISDTYASIEDVPREPIMRARIFEDGSVHLYELLETQGETPTISESESPVRILDVERIHDDFGMKPPYGVPAFGKGEHSCLVEMTVTSAESFAEYFGCTPSEVTDDALRSSFFTPAHGDADIGVELIQLKAEIQGNMISALLTVRVDEPTLFSAHAAEMGRRSGRDHFYVPEDAADAIFEAWFGANETCSPDCIGLEIVNWSAPADEESPGAGL